MTPGRPVGFLAGAAMRPLIDLAVAACGSGGAATAAAGPELTASQLGTITRSGGNRQVTYKGHPLCRFIKDKRPGYGY